jgi:hypothetical protein
MVQALWPANADATRRTAREKLIKLISFRVRLTVADLNLWSDRKMRVRRSMPFGANEI